MAVRQPDPEAFDIIRRGVARIVSVSDKEIGAAIRAYWTDTHNLVEGAGAAPLAALLRERDAMAGKRVGLYCQRREISIWSVPSVDRGTGDSGFRHRQSRIVAVAGRSKRRRGGHHGFALGPERERPRGCRATNSHGFGTAGLIFGGRPRRNPGAEKIEL